MFLKKITQISLICLGCVFSSLGVASSEEIQTKSLLNDDLSPMDLRVFGNKESKKIIYVFSSLSCPHCTIFHKEVMPELLNEYVQTGKAKLVYVEMPYDSKAMTGTVYSRCVTTKNYEAFMDKMFDTQDFWFNDERPRQIMLNFALELGEDKDALEACVINAELRKVITSQRNNLAELYNVTGMPSVVIVDEQSHRKFTGVDKDTIFKGIQSKLEVK